VSEKELIKNYVSKGGNAVFLFDYIESNPALTQFQDLLSTYNLKLDYDKVKENDMQRYVQSQYAVIVDAPQNNIIPVDSGLLLLNSRSIKILNNQKDYITDTPLAVTSNTAIGEQIDKNNGKNISGPLNLAVAVDYKGGTAPGKVLVMGNGLFVTDSAQQLPYFQSGYNFFTYSLGWMMGTKDDVQIAEKSLDPTVMTIGSAATANTIAFLVIVIFPLIILGFGTFVWLRRRHL
jgi:hypothetical protein